MGFPNLTESKSGRGNPGSSGTITPNSMLRLSTTADAAPAALSFARSRHASSIESLVRRRPLISTAWSPSCPPSSPDCSTRHCVQGCLEELLGCLQPNMRALCGESATRSSKEDRRKTWAKDRIRLCESRRCEPLRRGINPDMRREHIPYTTRGALSGHLYYSV